MSDAVTHKIRKFDELVTDQQVQEVIQKYALGAEIWWQRVYSDITQPVMNPSTGQPVATTVPVSKIYLGMKGVLIGPEYNIWWSIVLDAIPTMEKLEKYIMEGLQSMRHAKAQQANGQ